MYVCLHDACDAGNAVVVVAVWLWALPPIWFEIMQQQKIKLNAAAAATLP